MTQAFFISYEVGEILLEASFYFIDLINYRVVAKKKKGIWTPNRLRVCDSDDQRWQQNSLRTIQIQLTQMVVN